MILHALSRHIQVLGQLRRADPRAPPHHLRDPDPNGGDLTYYVYLSGSLFEAYSRLSGAKRATVGNTVQPVFSLARDEKYYWTVVPFDGEISIEECREMKWEVIEG